MPELKKDPFAVDLDKIFARMEVIPDQKGYTVNIDVKAIMNRHNFHKAYALLEYSSYLKQEMDKGKTPEEQVKIITDTIRKHGSHFSETIKAIMKLEDKPKIIKP